MERLLSFLCRTCLTHHHWTLHSFPASTSGRPPALCAPSEQQVSMELSSSGNWGNTLPSPLFPTTSARGPLKPNHDRRVLAWSLWLWKLSGGMPWALQSLTGSTRSHFPSNPWTKADGSAHLMCFSLFFFFSGIVPCETRFFFFSQQNSSN